MGAGIGHTAQNSEVLLLKDLPCPGMSAWASFDSSQERNSSSLAAVVSYLIAWEPPQPVHLHLCLPAVVCPFLFILAPQAGQSTVFIRVSLERQI